MLKLKREPQFALLVAAAALSFASLILLSPLSQSNSSSNPTAAAAAKSANSDSNANNINNTFVKVFGDDLEVISNVIVRREDAFKYRVCELRNVCISNNETIIFTTTDAKAKALTTKYKGCKKGNDAFCTCLKRSGVRFQALKNSSTSTLESFETTPTWLMYQWLPRHHVAHFAFSMIQFHSILLHTGYYNLPPFQTILFQDNPAPLNKYETALLGIVKSTGNLAALKNLEFLSHNSYEYQSITAENITRCFHSIHTSRQSEVYATSPEDLDVFRKTAETALNLNITVSPCPPTKAVILVRGKAKKGIHTVDVLDLNGSQSLEEQAALISQYGLIVSSHSSQTLGTMARLKYINSVGHAPDKSSRVHIQKLFGRVQKSCGVNITRANDCIVATADRETLKSVDYWVNLETFERDLNEGLSFVNEQCPSHTWI
ncbi:hypothetical protein BDR26DRAFT_931177 [Obelidium mucronatum]|nr:hypothetical protein BDR26DRAFT_931177 [Obelidium mucronatum]